MHVLYLPKRGVRIYHSEGVCLEAKHNSVVGTFPAEWSDEPAFSTLHGLRKTSGNSGEVFHDQGGREIDNEVTRNG